MQLTRTIRKPRLMASALAAVLIVTACGSSGSKSAGSAGGTSGGRASTANSALAAAVAATALAEKGTNRPVDPTPRPAVKGKHVVVISAAEFSISSQVPSDAAVAAAKAIGWQVDLYDAKGNPGNYAPLIRQAVAAGADGILLDGIDCQAVQQPLREAKAKGIAVVAFFAFDCNDPAAGGAPEGLYSATINYGPKEQANPDAFTESYAEDQANYIIAASHNTAKIIVIHDPEFTVLHYTLEGFKKTINASGGSKIVDVLNITSSDLNTVVPKIQAEMLRHPEATWIKSPFTYATTLGIVPALGAKAGQIQVMGGEGFTPELDLIRQGKVTAVNITSADWTGWAAIDTMNSVFRHEKPVDSGIGWAIADATHNLPASGEYVPPVDYKSQYKKAWGVA